MVELAVGHDVLCKLAAALCKLVCSLLVGVVGVACAATSVHACEHRLGAAVEVNDHVWGASVKRLEARQGAGFQSINHPSVAAHRRHCVLGARACDDVQCLEISTRKSRVALHHVHPPKVACLASAVELARGERCEAEAVPKLDSERALAGTGPTHHKHNLRVWVARERHVEAILLNNARNGRVQAWDGSLGLGCNKLANGGAAELDGVAVLAHDDCATAHVCRESIVLAALGHAREEQEAAVREAAQDVGQLKRRLRCGLHQRVLANELEELDRNRLGSIGGGGLGIGCRG